MRRLYRSGCDKKISGVCGGLGSYFKIDPSILRLLLVFLGTLTAFLPFLILYILAAVLIPEEPRNAPAMDFRRLYRIRKDRVFSGLFGGMARLFHADPIIVRLLAVVLTLITGFLPMALTYLVGWAIVPEKNV